MGRTSWSRMMRVIERLKKSSKSKSKERTFIDGIEKLFNTHYEKMQNSKIQKTNELFKMSKRGPGCVGQFHLELSRKIKKDLKRPKNIALYTRLLREISKET